MELSLSAEALEDLEQIITWLRERNAQAANDALDKIEAALDRLTTYPELGRIGRVEGTRELAVPGTGYVLFYEMRRPGIVDVLRVRHGRQDWPAE